MCAVEVTPVVSTERLILRGPVVTDASAIAGLVNDRNVSGMTGMIPHPYGLSDAEAWISRAQAADWDRDANWVIEHQAFGVVGGIGFKGGGAQKSGRPEIGYWLGRPFWNRGYATEAVRGALKWVKRDWRKNVVVAGHFADNPASGQVLCKAGFLYTGDVELRPSAARGRDDVPTRMMVWLA
jgi:RimJ/RimL family protein N-acetyltransferase